MVPHTIMDTLYIYVMRMRIDKPKRRQSTLNTRFIDNKRENNAHDGVKQDKAEDD